MRTLGYAYAYTRMHTHAQALHTHALCMRMQTLCMHMHTHVRVLEIMKGKFFALKFGFWNKSHIVWEPFQTPIFEL